MKSEANTKIYDIMVLGAKEKFAEWIKSRGGVMVWHCVNLSNLTGPTFTPALTEYPPTRGLVQTRKPSWTVSSLPGETITDLARFRFAKELKEVRRFRVAIRPSSNGMAMKLTDASSKRVRAATDKAGDEATYRFDYETQEAVIEVPVWG